MTSRKRRRISEESIPPGMACRIRDTESYKNYFDNNTVQSTRIVARKAGVTRWYSMKKKELVSIVVLDQYVRRIQRFFRTKGMNIKKRKSMFGGLDGERCIISMEVITDIPVRNRFMHSNHWFDREQLAKFLRTSCDFVHPVTRVEFTYQDVSIIDKSLLTLFEGRKDTRSSMISRMETVQCIENELEEIFKEMIEMAYITTTRNAFNVNMSYSEVQFEECFKDLLHIDRNRCIMVLKSLPDLIEGDMLARVYMSQKRSKELRDLVKEFIYRAECD